MKEVSPVVRRLLRLLTIFFEVKVLRTSEPLFQTYKHSNQLQIGKKCSMGTARKTKGGFLLWD